VAVIIVYGADLLFLSRIETQLAPLGHEVRRARLAAPVPGAELAICDVEAVDPEAAVAALRPARLLGYGSHEQPEALVRARAAGFDRVVARSAIAARLPALAADLLDPATPPDTMSAPPDGDDFPR
jgi:hypothetical protein